MYLTYWLCTRPRTPACIDHVSLPRVMHTQTMLVLSLHGYLSHYMYITPSILSMATSEP